MKLLTKFDMLKTSYVGASAIIPNWICIIQRREKSEAKLIGIGILNGITHRNFGVKNEILIFITQAPQFLNHILTYYQKSHFNGVN